MDVKVERITLIIVMNGGVALTDDDNGYIF